jgi:hypothetical protein
MLYTMMMYDFTEHMNIIFKRIVDYLIFNLINEGDCDESLRYET